MAKKTTILLILCGLLSIFLSSTLKAQTGAYEEVLKKAEFFYENGLLDTIPPHLEECIKKGNKNEQIRGYKLIVMSYFFNEEIPKADTAYLSLLKVYPIFEPNLDVDKPDFVLYTRSFVSRPFLSFGLRGGVNFTHINVLNSFSVDNVNSTEEQQKQYLYKPGFQIGAFANLHVKKWFEINVEAAYSQRSYGYKNSFNSFLGHESQGGDGIVGVYGTFEFSESQSWLDIPLTFKFNLGGKRTVPYVYFGGEYNQMLFYPQLTVLKLRETEEPSPVNLLGYDNALDEDTFISMRTTNNWSTIAGAGMKFRTGRSFIFFDLRYGMRLNNSVVPKNRYASNELIWKYGHVDDDFQMHNGAISLGYMYSIYKRKKLKTR